MTAILCTTLLALVGCAHADAPELFRADPALQNDYTLGLPAFGRTGGFEYEIIQGLAIYEGDILLGEVDPNGEIASTLRSRGLARSDAFGRWPDGIVPYVAPVGNSPTQRKNIEQAITHWTERTRMTFVERTTENAQQYPHYLRFASSNSCASYVGMQGGEQSIMVSDACSPGSIIHEIGHALGLFHEHTRSDRDNYVQIDWSQIVDGKDINFNLQVAGAQNIGPYDYGSIMHYGEYFFSSAANKPTIIVPNGVEIGQRIALSDIDTESIDQLYATDLALLAPGVSTNSNGLELDVTVLNQGNLGAHHLELIVKMTNDANWQGISRDSGWQCLTFDSELRCSRPTLTEQSESRFSLLVNPGSGSADDIGMLLRSRTLDLNPANNAINDDGLLGKTSTASSAGETAADVPLQINSVPGTEPVQIPAVGAAQSGNSATTNAAAAGSHNGSLGLMLMGLLGWRRFRPGSDKYKQ